MISGIHLTHNDNQKWWIYAPPMHTFLIFFIFSIGLKKSIDKYIHKKPLYTSPALPGCRPGCNRRKLTRRLARTSLVQLFRSRARSRRRPIVILRKNFDIVASISADAPYLPSLGAAPTSARILGLTRRGAGDAVVRLNLTGAHQRHPALLAPLIDRLLAHAQLLAETNLSASGGYPRQTRCSRSSAFRYPCVRSSWPGRARATSSPSV